MLDQATVRTNCIICGLLEYIVLDWGSHSLSTFQSWCASWSWLLASDMCKFGHCVHEKFVITKHTELLWPDLLHRATMWSCVLIYLLRLNSWVTVHPDSSHFHPRCLDKGISTISEYHFNNKSYIYILFLKFHHAKDFSVSLFFSTSIWILLVPCFSSSAFHQEISWRRAQTSTLLSIANDGLILKIENFAFEFSDETKIMLFVDKILIELRCLFKMENK